MNLTAKEDYYRQYSRGGFGMRKEKLKIIEYMHIKEYRKQGILVKEGYKCRQQELIDDYVYIEWCRYE